MIVRKTIVICGLLAAASCSRPVQVPTEAAFERDPALLKTWIEKCRSGEYSNLGADEKLRMCGSAESAAGVMTQKQAGKDADDAFSNAILRK
jgi:hypothetical protein